MGRFVFQSNALLDSAAADVEQLLPIEHIMSFPIVLSDRIRLAVENSKSYKLECAEVCKLVDHLSQMLRSAVRFANTTTSFYDRPVRRVFVDVSRNLNRALTLVRKCRRRSIFLRVVSIVGAADFRKIFNLLEASIGDMKWLLSIFDADGDSGGENGGVLLSLPPIASNDPILAWIWSYIVSIHLCPINVKIEVADELCSLAYDNDRNKKIIVEEGGIPPLLKLLKETSWPKAQIAAATTLFNLANDQVRARLIANELGVPIIVQALGDSPIRVQIALVKLIARMAEHDQISQEGFARENVIPPLVTLLSFETFMDVDLHKVNQYSKKSIQSIVEIKKQMERSSFLLSDNKGGSSSPMWSKNRNDSENESPELKYELKTSCAGALWMLVRGSVANSKTLTDTKGLLCLAKLIETEQGELQINCLMTVMETAAAAESNADLRKSTFKPNSPAAKAIVDQLVRLIHEADNPIIKIPAIKAIGSLARTFAAKQTVVICPLVKQLSQKNPDVATESAIVLGKFAGPENFLCSEHSKTIIEFDGVPPLMRLLRGSERTQYHALVLLCYLAMNAGESEAVEQARVLTALEGVDKSVAGQHSELRELVTKAIYHLRLYHAGAIPPQRQSYAISRDY